MKHKPKELGLISLDRLKVIEERVLNTLNEYKSLLESLDHSFSRNDSYSIKNLQKMEVQLIKTLTNRIRIFESHIEYLKKNGIDYNKNNSDVYNGLDSLKLLIKNYRDKLKQEKEKLNKEISSVNRTTSKLSRYRDITATRIDIIT